MFGMKIDKTVEMETPAGTIDGEAYRAVIRLVNDRICQHEGFLLDYPRVFGILGDDWTVTKGKFAGTFPKRLRNFLNKNHGVKLTPEVMSEIGNIAKSSMSNTAGRYNVAITRTLWDAGDYGDDGSCYFGTNDGAPKAIFGNDGYAITIDRYNEKDCEPETTEDSPCNCADCRAPFREGFQKYARCWSVPFRNMYVVFNTYSKGNGFHTVKIARMIATHFGLSYAEVRLSNHGTDSGMVWINGGRGYLIGRADDINGFASATRTSLELVNLNIDPPPIRCDSCAGPCDGGPMYAGDETLCRGCWDDLFTYCDNCGSVESVDDIIACYQTTAIRSNPSYRCQRCADRNYTRCDDCEEYISNSRICRYDAGTYCENCADVNVSFCEACGEESFDTFCDDCEADADQLIDEAA